jgi:FKBP-type peptidyl-prolyl cis-trans isomerase FkpA/FKBP-type peptidyl-prolyl cis-trans isomerase FklB
MNLRSVGVGFAAVSLALMGCSGDGASSSASAALDTDDQKASYGIGLNMGSQLEPAAERIDRPALMRGIEDALRGNDSAIPADEIQEILMAFGQEIEAAANAERDRDAQENAVAGEAFLAQNGRKDGVTTTASGLQYEVLRQGDGARPLPDQQVRLHYRGTLIDGTEFDSSYGGDPAVFTTTGLISGFSEALLLMPVGSHYRIFIPSDLGYGPMGSGPIGPNATLIFEIELLEIVDAA